MKERTRFGLSVLPGKTLKFVWLKWVHSKKKPGRSEEIFRILLFYFIKRSLKDEGYFFIVLIFVSVAWSFTIGLIRGYGVFISAWMGDFGVSMKSAQYIFTFSTIGSCMNSFVAPVILKNFGTRRMMLMASVGLSVSQAAVALTTNLLQAQILLGIVGGFFFNNFVYTSNIVLQVTKVAGQEDTVTFYKIYLKHKIFIHGKTLIMRTVSLKNGLFL